MADLATAEGDLAGAVDGVLALVQQLLDQVKNGDPAAIQAAADAVESQANRLKAALPAPSPEPSPAPVPDPAPAPVVDPTPVDPTPPPTA